MKITNTVHFPCYREKLGLKVVPYGRHCGSYFLNFPLGEVVNMAATWSFDEERKCYRNL
jgi:hypothetical protein